MDTRPLVIQFVRFGIIGVISFMVSLIFNYTASMRFVFTHGDGVSRWHDFTVFVISALIGLIITAVIIWISTYGLSDTTSQAYVI